MFSKLFKSLFLLVVIVSFTPIGAYPERKLKFQDISPIMDQLFDYHIDQKDLSETTVERSLKIYVKQFDPEASYFLASEIAPYIHPKHDLIFNTLNEFKQDDYSLFQETNALIQKTIERNQELRKDLFNDYEKVFADANHLPLTSDETPYEEKFASNEQELKEKIYEQGLRFFKVQEIKHKRPLTAEEKEKVVKLYLKKLEDSESIYFADNYSRKERQHLVTLRVLKSLAKSLDSHTAYFSSAEAYNMRINLEKGFQGIGVVLEETFDGVKINRIIKGGPADKSKALKKGDFIISVNGTDITEKPFSSILDMIRGEKDTKITLGIKRYLQEEEKKESEASFLSVVLKRGKVTLDDQRVEISHEKFGEDGIIGIVSLYSFYEGDDGISSVNDVKKALEDLSKEGDLKGLILDLRENSGGFLSQAVKVAGLFISNGVVVTSKYSNNDQRVFRDLDGRTYYDGPLLVLTSKASASAAEIVAQSLQDYGASINVGDTTTYGKGSIQHQTITNEESDNHFKVTVGRYYTVSGKSTQINGVQADIVVPGKLSHEKVGERYLDFPLAYDTIEPSFQDQLMDLDKEARKWFQKYYTPSLETPDDKWKSLLPLLKKNSQFRITHNQDYQRSLSELQEDLDLSEEENNQKLKDALAKIDELQQEEALNIIKDMILMKDKISFKP